MVDQKDILLLIEKNLYSKFLYLPQILGYKIVDRNEIKIIDSGLDSSMFNIVCQVGSAKNGAKEIVRYVTNYYKNNKFAWWGSASNINPELKKEIIAAGLRDEGNERAMYCSLSNFTKFELDNKIVIKQVESYQELLDYIKIISSYDENANNFLDNKLIISERVKAQNPLFVAYINEVVVGTGSLHFSNNLAGIFDIVTLKNERGKGVGTNMMKYVVNYAYEKKIYDLCLSASSDSGFSIYKKLGFNEVGKFSCYEWYGK